MKALFVFLFSMIIAGTVLAQHSYSGGLQLEFKPSFSFKNDWKLSTKLSPRFLFFEGSETESFHGISDFKRVELELVMTKNVNEKQSFGMGYLIREQDGEIIHRMIQQFEISTSRGDLGLEHRFRLDETFYQHDATSYRFRYRFSLEKPLKTAEGEKKKSYLFLSNEFLPRLQGKEGELEIRVIPGMGFQLDDKNKLELGLEYRIEKLFQSSHHQLFLFNIAWSPRF